MGTLELQNLTYSYDKKKKVLRGIDARMEAGKMYAILGPSGCGKTTLLSLLGGLDSPTSGAILFEGKDVAQTGLAGHRKKSVSFIFQSYNLIDYMTPQENWFATPLTSVMFGRNRDRENPTGWKNGSASWNWKTVTVWIWHWISLKTSTVTNLFPEGLILPSMAWTWPERRVYLARIRCSSNALTRWPMPSITWQNMVCPQQTMAMQPGMSKRSYTNTASQNTNRR